MTGSNPIKEGDNNIRLIQTVRRDNKSGKVVTTRMPGTEDVDLPKEFAKAREKSFSKDDDNGSVVSADSQSIDGGNLESALRETRRGGIMAKLKGMFNKNKETKSPSDIPESKVKEWEQSKGGARR